jgi:putative transposase
MRNVLAHAGKTGRRVVSAFIATAFAPETAEAASVKWRAAADQIRAQGAKARHHHDPRRRHCWVASAKS